MSAWIFCNVGAQNAANIFGLTSILTPQCGKSALKKQGRSYYRLPRLTRVEPRYGLCFCLLPSALHSFLQYESIPANSCFPRTKKVKSTNSPACHLENFLIYRSRSAPYYERITSDKTRSIGIFQMSGVTSSTIVSLARRVSNRNGILRLLAQCMLRLAKHFGKFRL